MNMNDAILKVMFEHLTREQVAYLLKLTKDLGHTRTVLNQVGERKE
jgi:hypothetical protein